jgi:excisionase family DNA binding protein
MPVNDLLSGPALLTYTQVAEHLGISLSKVRRLIRAGDLTAVNVGERNPRVRRADLAAYIADLAPRAS